MPYITQDGRPIFEEHIAKLTTVDLTPGELNYVITRLILGFVAHRGLRYDTIAAVTGVLENAKQEFYRRVAARYEDTKIVENGDVY